LQEVSLCVWTLAALNSVLNRLLIEAPEQMLSAALGGGAQKAFALSSGRCGKFGPSFTLAVVLDQPTERFSRELGVFLRRLTITVDRGPICRIELRRAKGCPRFDGGASVSGW
jgi:hypothetical protein